ncbi:hypothetical protein H9660_14645 [Clostridium sp. Sa3CUN1]|jgi:antitoxin component of RelBE/YafQ-DinJ toxin-antitoxin module|uniref:Ribbon-helix-helix protein CopG domain-containing protein n=1 Tax=Clostridium gallinarum TaxID=2762246 RepID=A0ABR8Q7I6_9CLOT|nr:hypothetical protein [Clostridium gallinarum]MBD7916383.1 hypothetical protein [Clostridium gallinarum]
MVKDDILKVRLTKEEKQQIRYFAKRKGLNMSEYIKLCIMKVENNNMDIDKEWGLDEKKVLFRN